MSSLLLFWAHFGSISKPKFKPKGGLRPKTASTSSVRPSPSTAVTQRHQGPSYFESPTGLVALLHVQHQWPISHTPMQGLFGQTFLPREARQLRPFHSHDHPTCTALLFSCKLAGPRQCGLSAWKTATIRTTAEAPATTCRAASYSPARPLLVPRTVRHQASPGAARPFPSGFQPATSLLHASSP